MPILKKSNICKAAYIQEQKNGDDKYYKRGQDVRASRNQDISPEDTDKETWVLVQF